MDLSEITTSAWISAAGTLVAGILVTLVASRGISRAAKPLRIEADVARILSRTVRAVVFVLVIVIVLDQLGVEMGPLIGALGISSVLVAVSLQPVLGNLVGSVMLQARRPIRFGDQIVSNGQSGTVVDINGRAVVLKSFDGEIIHLPNLKVLDQPLVNKTGDEFRRTSIPFEVAYETDLRQAQSAVVVALRSLPELEFAPPADVLVTEFGESGVSMVARIWHPSEELTTQWTVSEAAITIRETLAAANITIPFPQRVLRFESDPELLTQTGSVDEAAFNEAVGEEPNGQANGIHSNGTDADANGEVTSKLSDEQARY